MKPPKWDTRNMEEIEIYLNNLYASKFAGEPHQLKILSMDSTSCKIQRIEDGSITVVLRKSIDDNLKSEILNSLNNFKPHPDVE